MKQPDYRLTEKRMSDARFRRTEKLIFDAICQKDPTPSVRQITKTTGLAKSTFYLHHATSHAIIPDIKWFILQKYVKSIHGQVQIKRLYTTTLFFILNHKRFFLFLTGRGDRDFLIKMLRQLDAQIELTARLPQNSDKILRVHSGEICELIFCWCESGMPEEGISRLISETLFLTKTLRPRLMQLLS